MTIQTLMIHVVLSLRVIVFWHQLKFYIFSLISVSLFCYWSQWLIVFLRMINCPLHMGVYVCIGHLLLIQLTTQYKMKKWRKWGTSLKMISRVENWESYFGLNESLDVKRHPRYFSYVNTLWYNKTQSCGNFPNHETDSC
jgi:hypothetical protein